MERSLADMLEELIEASADLANSKGIVSPAKAVELEENIQRIKTEINDSVVTKSWLYDFLTNNVDDKGRGAGA